MCSSAAPDPMPLIDAYSTDEELILFLWERKVGDLIPSNVVTGVNPFSVEPWDSSENRWYLYHQDHTVSSTGRESFTELPNLGYWIATDNHKILTGSPVVGRKTVWEFYIGTRPLGDRSCWKIHEYETEQMIPQCGANKAPDCISLCRVFYDESPKCEEQHESPECEGQHESLSADDADSVLAREALGEEQRPRQQDTEILYRTPEPQDISRGKTHRDPASVDVDSACGRGCYLELNDFNDLGAFSSSMIDPGLTCSESYDDYFNADDLLRDIFSDMEEGNACRCGSLSPR